MGKSDVLIYFYLCLRKLKTKQETKSLYMLFQNVIQEIWMLIIHLCVKNKKQEHCHIGSMKIEPNQPPFLKLIVKSNLFGLVLLYSKV